MSEFFAETVEIGYHGRFRRAKDIIEKSIPGAKVVGNPSKPRMGAFEVIGPVSTSFFFDRDVGSLMHIC